MSDTAAKKDIQKLQRAIVDGLEDIKAQDIRVFNTEHLSPLFERVIVASGTSNRQTQALAASVRDKVRDAGFAKPRLEGEDNGEWIIIDCGAAVAHVMQPVIRQYYNLEEIWGDKPVRVRLAGAAVRKPKASADAAPARAATSLTAGQKAAAKKTASKGTSGTARPAAGAKPSAKAGARKAAPAAGKAAPRKPAAKSLGAKRPVAKKATPQKVLVVGKPAAAKKVVASSRAGAPARKSPTRPAR